MRQTRRLSLLVLLLVTGLAMTLFGTLLRMTVGSGISQLAGVPAPAIPLVLLADPTILQVAGAETAEPSVPDAEAPAPEIPTAPETPPEAEPSRPADTETASPSEPGAPPQTPADPEETGGRTIGCVDESYFDTVLFIGDSRTVGLSQYGRLGKADYFADTGMTVFNVLTETASDTGFSAQTLPELLQTRSYDRIYVMLGINEIGYALDRVLDQYGTVVETLQSLQPDAILVLCANLHVSRSAAAATPRLEPSHIQELDDRIAQLADGDRIVFLDVNPEFCDSEGYLRDDLTGDGVHPYGTGYELWAEWLVDHGVT